MKESDLNECKFEEECSWEEEKKLWVEALKRRFDQEWTAGLTEHNFTLKSDFTGRIANVEEDLNTKIKLIPRKRRSELWRCLFEEARSLSIKREVLLRSKLMYKLNVLEQNKGF